MKLQKSETDFGIFIQQFSMDSWIGILFMAGAAVACFLLADIFNSENNTNAPNILTFIFHVFFVLVYAYYGGVLTMFFTTIERPPFETEKKVLQANPNWRMKYRDYLAREIHQMASQGDPVYVSALERYEENPSEWMYDSLAKGLEFVMRGPHVIKESQHMFSKHHWWLRPVYQPTSVLRAKIY